ncbi:hypothetical protein V1477_020063 [Vespula maculifrons]|uniref:Uncharacterized protein n=1 Tax=Vespula maculifrons TaxID=7453 RepID=A0ABD2AKW2_VESMC
MDDEGRDVLLDPRESPPMRHAANADHNDKPTKYRRLQGLFQRRLVENRLAINGRTEETLPNTLGLARSSR